MYFKLAVGKSPKPGDSIVSVLQSRENVRGNNMFVICCSLFLQQQQQRNGIITSMST